MRGFRAAGPRTPTSRAEPTRCLGGTRCARPAARPAGRTWGAAGWRPLQRLAPARRAVRACRSSGTSSAGDRRVLGTSGASFQYAVLCTPSTSASSVRMTTWRQLMRCRLASSAGAQPARNVCSRGWVPGHPVVQRLHRPPFLCVVDLRALWPARRALQPRPGVPSGQPAAIRSPAIRPSTSGYSNSCGPSCSPATIGLEVPVAASRPAVATYSGMRTRRRTGARCTGRTRPGRRWRTWSKNFRGALPVSLLNTS